MKVSIIIPVYNEEKYIEECIFSLLNQTKKADEIIVINDGSTDNSKLKVKVSKLQYKIQKLKLITQRHKGPGIARNNGAKKASGDILIFPDADMRFDRRYIEKLVEPIEKGKALATFTSKEYVANVSNCWSRCWSINSFFPVNLHIDPNIPKEANNFRAIRKDVFLKTKGYHDVGYGEDISVLDQLQEIKAKVIRDAICYHFNPSTLKEVFESARWIGRGEVIKRNIKNFLIYSIFNSIRKGIITSFMKKEPEFLIFKIVFDIGVFCGMVNRIFGKDHTK